MKRLKKHSEALLVIHLLIYGFLIVNWIDFSLPFKDWYHIILIVAYFSPTPLVALVVGWRKAIAYGLLISLANDLGYGIFGNIFGITNYDLTNWFLRQFGFQGDERIFTFQGGFFKFDVTSIMMGVSILFRIILIAVMGWKNAVYKC